MAEDDVAGVGLTPTQLNKYQWRAEMFVDKVWTQTPMELTIGSHIVPTSVIVDGIEYDPTVVDKSVVLDAIINIPNYKKIFVQGTVDGEHKKIVSSKITKSADFGGKPSGFELKCENAALGSIRTQLTTAIDNNNGDPITITVGRHSFHNIVDVVSTPGHPKSDIHFVADDGKEGPFISHKAGTKSADFQQYSGVSKFYNHPEVEQFVADLVDHFDGVIPRRTLLHRPIRDPELIKQSIYGHDYVTGKFGFNNVNAMIQGSVNLVPTSSTSKYKLDGTKMFLNGSIPTDENYRPTMMVSYRTGKLNTKMTNGRLGIYPYKCFGYSRLVEEF